MQQLRWETSSRYYVARAYQDLLGDWIVEKAWGGLHNHLGNGQQEIVSTYEAALQVIGCIHRERKARRYHLVRNTDAS